MTLTIEHDADGPYALLLGALADRDAELLRARGIDRLVARAVPDLDFLGAVPRLRSFTVLHLPLRDVTGVVHQPDLEELNLGAYYETPVDFARFGSLRKLVVEWGPGAMSLAAATTLRDLAVTHYPGVDLRPLGKLTELERLYFSQGRLRSLDGIGVFERLGALRLLALRRLADISGLGAATPQLHDLTFDTCRSIADLSPLRSLVGLRTLAVLNCGPIASLAPLDGMDLERLYFYESTDIIDGDLSVLLRLPHLGDVAFANRRHYSHTREAIQKALAEMRSG